MSGLEQKVTEATERFQQTRKQKAESGKPEKHKSRDHTKAQLRMNCLIEYRVAPDALATALDNGV